MEYGFLSRTSFLFHSSNLSARLLKLLVIFTRLHRAVNTPSEIYGYHDISIQRAHEASHNYDPSLPPPNKNLQEMALNNDLKGMNAR